MKYATRTKKNIIETNFSQSTCAWLVLRYVSLRASNGYAMNPFINCA